MPNEKTVDQQTPAEPQSITREMFDKLQEQANQQSAIVRKLTLERESSAQKMTAIEQRFAEIADKLETSSKPKDTPKSDPMAAELKALRAQYEAEKAEREKERVARMTQEERTALSQALAAKGVTGPHLKGAMALLYDAEKRITRDEAGIIAFKVQRNGFDEVLPLEKALDEWLGTEDGKAYMPPRQVSGSGVTPGRSPGNSADGKMTQAQAAALLRDLMAQ